MFTRPRPRGRSRLQLGSVALAALIAYLGLAPRHRRGQTDRTKGKYTSWRATRATGDFDLRAFSIRAYPVDKVPGLRPGMSAYLDWRTRG